MKKKKKNLKIAICSPTEPHHYSFFELTLAWLLVKKVNRACLFDFGNGIGLIRFNHLHTCLQK